MNSRFKMLLISSLISALAACGGGSGPNTDAEKSASETTVETPVVAAAPVAASESNHPLPVASTGMNITPAQSAAVAAPTASTTTVEAASVASAASATTPTTEQSKPATAATSTPSSIFYGVNGHATEGGAYDISSDSLQLQQLQTLGAKIYRNEVIGSNGAQRVATRAKVMAAGGIAMDPVMLLGIGDVSSESDGYNKGFALGKATAQAYAFPYIEVTNEIEATCLTGNVDGVYPTDYDNAKYQKARGIIRGMVDGAKSINPGTKIIMGGGAWLHYGFYQMLHNGTQPDGTAGHPAVDWDITAWHWYSDQGDIEAASGGTGVHNVLQTLQAFGKPIWLNEFGVRPNYGSNDQIASYLVGNRMMAEFVKDASKYNITSIQFYELYDDPAGGEGAYGLIQNDGKSLKPAYTAYKNFVAANPK